MIGDTEAMKTSSGGTQRWIVCGLVLICVRALCGFPSAGSQRAFGVKPPGSPGHEAGTNPARISCFVRATASPDVFVAAVPFHHRNGTSPFDGLPDPQNAPFGFRFFPHVPACLPSVADSDVWDELSRLVQRTVRGRPQLSRRVSAPSSVHAFGTTFSRLKPQSWRTHLSVLQI